MDGSGKTRRFRSLFPSPTPVAIGISLFRGRLPRCTIPCCLHPGVFPSGPHPATSPLGSTYHSFVSTSPWFCLGQTRFFLPSILGSSHTPSVSPPFQMEAGGTRIAQDSIDVHEETPHVLPHPRGSTHRAFLVRRCPCSSRKGGTRTEKGTPKHRDPRRSLPLRRTHKCLLRNPPFRDLLRRILRAICPADPRFPGLSPSNSTPNPPPPTSSAGASILPLLSSSVEGTPPSKGSWQPRSEPPPKRSGRARLTNVAKKTKTRAVLRLRDPPCRPQARASARERKPEPAEECPVRSRGRKKRRCDGARPAWPVVRSWNGWDSDTKLHVDRRCKPACARAQVGRRGRSQA